MISTRLLWSWFSSPGSDMRWTDCCSGNWRRHFVTSGERPSPLPAEQHAADLAPAFGRHFACNQSVDLKADVTKRLAPRLAAPAAGRPTVMTSTGFRPAI